MFRVQEGTQDSSGIVCGLRGVFSGTDRALPRKTVTELAGREPSGCLERVDQVIERSRGSPVLGLEL